MCTPIAHCRLAARLRSLFGVLAPLASCVGSAAEPEARLPPLEPVTAADSVLIVAPHPDDESLCCGGLIDMARRAGAAVSIVWITSGDGFRWDAMVVEKTPWPRGGAFNDLGRRRISEARAAAGVLQVPPERRFFLGYPDRGILPLLFDYYHKDWRSKYTRDTAVPFMDEFRPGATYDGEDLVRDFTAVVERVQPTRVLAPSPQDTHPDHRATGLLAMRVMEARNARDRIRYWIVHGGHGWPSPRKLRIDMPQTIAPRGAGMDWEELVLDDAAREAKYAAVLEHRTQREVMGRVMMSYVRATELYSRIPVPPNDSRCLSAEPCEFEKMPASEKAAL